VLGFPAARRRGCGLAPALRRAPGLAGLFCGNPTRDWLQASLPYASVYSGHQFGVWAGQRGDGRALTIGELAHDGRRYELQLKGAGRTPYSRMGDGRAVLLSSNRELLCSEAKQPLGQTTTRAAGVIGSGRAAVRRVIETCGDCPT
ncbi:protein adenylyltransferase SelO family protein, partial [Burkholderia pseudomallei]|uniref:protein adenylyltransferase SelO family protein n=1 Tax=Burkholderia pseudomallei TaxID=28450 RepID=UPI0015E1A444